MPFTRINSEVSDFVETLYGNHSMRVFWMLFSIMLEQMKTQSIQITCTCQKGVGPVEQTASALGRCTCYSSSQSPVRAAQQSDRLHEDASRSRRFSSPTEYSRYSLVDFYYLKHYDVDNIHFIQLFLFSNMLCD